MARKPTQRAKGTLEYYRNSPIAFRNDQMMEDRFTLTGNWSSPNWTNNKFTASVTNGNYGAMYTLLHDYQGNPSSWSLGPRYMGFYAKMGATSTDGDYLVLTGPVPYGNGFGFWMDGGYLFCYASAGDSGHYTKTNTNLGKFGAGETHLYEAVFDPDVGSVAYYLDRVHLMSIATNTPTLGTNEAEYALTVHVQSGGACPTLEFTLYSCNITVETGL